MVRPPARVTPKASACETGCWGSAAPSRGAPRRGAHACLRHCKACMPACVVVWGTTETQKLMQVHSAHACTYYVKGVCICRVLGGGAASTGLPAFLCATRSCLSCCGNLACAVGFTVQHRSLAVYKWLLGEVMRRMGVWAAKQPCCAHGIANPSWACTRFSRPLIWAAGLLVGLNHASMGGAKHPDDQSDRPVCVVEQRAQGQRF